MIVRKHLGVVDITYKTLCLEIQIGELNDLNDNLNFSRDV